MGVGLRFASPCTLKGQLWMKGAERLILTKGVASVQDTSGLPTKWMMSSCVLEQFTHKSQLRGEQSNQAR
eukprot:622922-Amphidinium_carterae.1